MPATVLDAQPRRAPRGGELGVPVVPVSRPPPTAPERGDLVLRVFNQPRRAAGRRRRAVGRITARG